jgi:hypothetical protein
MASDESLIGKDNLEMVWKKAVAGIFQYEWPL